MFFEDMAVSLELYDDAEIYMYYIYKLDQSIESACKLNFEVAFISSRLFSAGKKLFCAGYIKSFDSIITVFENIIDETLNNFKGLFLEEKNDEEEQRLKIILIWTQRYLLYFISNTQYDLPEKCSKKIEEILCKNKGKQHYNLALAHSVPKTAELLREDKDSCERLLNKSNMLFGTHY
jgi:hypothetical protein